MKCCITIVIRRNSLETGPSIAVFLLFSRSKLKKRVRPERRCTLPRQDGLCVGDYCPEDVLATILEFIEAGMLDEDEEFNEEINTLLSEQSAVTYSCEICTQVCKSKQCLRRHRNTRHTERPSFPTKTKVAEDMLHPLYFKQYVNDAAKKLGGGCYSKKNSFSFKGISSG